MAQKQTTQTSLLQSLCAWFDTAIVYTLLKTIDTSLEKCSSGLFSQQNCLEFVSWFVCYLRDRNTRISLNTNASFPVLVDSNILYLLFFQD